MHHPLYLSFGRVETGAFFLTWSLHNPITPECVPIGRLLGTCIHLHHATPNNSFLHPTSNVFIGFAGVDTPF